MSVIATGTSPTHALTATSTTNQDPANAPPSSIDATRFSRLIAMDSAIRVLGMLYGRVLRLISKYLARNNASQLSLALKPELKTRWYVPAQPLQLRDSAQPPTPPDPDNLDTSRTTDSEAQIRIQIPYDVLCAIFELLQSDRAALRALSRASKSFCEEAQRVLFMDVTTLKGYRAHFKFLRAVAEAPNHLAPLVRAYDMGPLSMLDDELAQAALKAMRNLKRLDMSSVGMHINHALMLRGCAFNLKHFDWDQGVENADEIMRHFLPSQNALRHLSVRCSERAIISADICPQLVYVQGYWSMIKALLPGHKIATLSVLDSISLSEESIKPFKRERIHVKALSVRFYGVTNSNSELDLTVLQHFPRLTVLELTGIDPNENLFTLDKETPFFKMLSKLPSLRTLILHRPDEFENKFRKKIPQFIQTLFANFGKHLTCVVLQTIWGTFIRYTQNGKKEISELEVKKVWLDNVMDGTDD